MKFLTSFMLLSMFLADNSHGGGVTVGNGQGSIIVGFSLQNQFMNENQLKKSAEELIYRIQRRDYQRINDIIETGKCNPDYINIGDFKSRRFYVIDQGVFRKDKEYIGYLKVELKDCKNISAISADEPYGGDEFWEY